MSTSSQEDPWECERVVFARLVDTRRALAPLVGRPIAGDDETEESARQDLVTNEQVRAHLDATTSDAYTPHTFVPNAAAVLAARGRLRNLFFSNAQMGDEPSPLDALQRRCYATPASVTTLIPRRAGEAPNTDVLLLRSVFASAAADVFDAYKGDWARWWQEYRDARGLLSFASVARQRAFVLDCAAMVEHMCSACSFKRAYKRCSRCHRMRYCSAECQRTDWPRHSHWCHVAPDAV